jgi:prepilin-type processing-associated H-X9-DG protein
MSSIRIRCFILIAAAFAGTEASAQVDQMSFNFGEITAEYRAARTGAVPFALDFTAGESGSIAIRPFGGHGLTFKRGVFAHPDPLPEAWLYFDLQRTRTRSAGLLAVGILQGPGGTQEGPHVRVFDSPSSGGSGVHAGGANFAMADGSVRFMRDSSDVRLYGQPAELFNQPRRGEPLEARLPTPEPGQVIDLLLTIGDDRGARMDMPVRISRPR